MVTQEAAQGQDIGRVVDYFAHISVAGIDLTGRLDVGDSIRISGHTTDFEQSVESIQIEHSAVDSAKAGDKIGIKVIDRCRRGDRVYKL
jgi:selenocysteine-specific translation elongation factor